MCKNISVLALTTIVYILQLCKTANADLREIETEFYDHYRRYGSAVEWTGFQQIFCEFMQPTGSSSLVNTDVGERFLELATFHDVIPTNVLTCTYDDGVGWFARSPSGTYCELGRLGSGADFMNFGIKDEIDRPPANVEKLFYNHYNTYGQDTSFKFPPNMIDHLCKSKLCQGFSTSEIQIDTQNIVLFSLGREKVNVQVLICYYTRDDGREAIPSTIEGFMRTQWYPYVAKFAKGPNNKYYELRLFGDPRSSGLAINRETRLRLWNMPDYLQNRSMLYLKEIDFNAE